MTKEDIECIIKWFSHIEQLATDGKTANGFQMPTDRLLATIKVVAKDSREYVEKFFNESIPNDLEEASRRYQEDVPVDTTIHYCGADEDVYFANRIIDAFIAGAKWDREQMLKEAVDAKIYGYGDGSYELIASWLDLPKGNYKDGDKVRIIIAKED